MKKEIVLIVVFLMIGTFALACQCESDVPPQEPLAQFEPFFKVGDFLAGDFLSGIVSGITDQIVENTPIDTCFNEFGLNASFTEQLGRGLQLIESGLANKQIKDIESGLYQFVTSINSIKAPLSACNQTTVFTVIDSLSQFHGQDWSNVFNIITKKCDIEIVYTNFHYQHEITRWFDNAISAWNGRSFNLSGFYIGRIVDLAYTNSLMK
ncbi:hypothetical protein DFA_02365 [Cavenderia fasciculata]|uniref:Uncharacterized protein n=1 Tax=Cavenderia fasciculata TaxID=261658 RepID=F4PZ89_CACFS|nr:uncharacterized protein DFA_02365 [Cavenderia fasciculata]EGG19118.1 hypothetical protein DFA_02365 [Cavenderia fasciculata]|eukprot:XP_004366751.1 hypothetical protein DFA_02365 [Cavenderia fasciculata]